MRQVARCWTPSHMSSASLARITSKPHTERTVYDCILDVSTRVDHLGCPDSSHRSDVHVTVWENKAGEQLLYRKKVKPFSVKDVRSHLVSSSQKKIRRKSPKAAESNGVHLSILTFKAVFYGINLKKKNWKPAHSSAENWTSLRDNDLCEMLSKGSVPSISHRSTTGGGSGTLSASRLFIKPAHKDRRECWHRHKLALIFSVHVH